MKKLLAIVLFLFSSAALAQAAPQNTLAWDYTAADVATFGVTGFRLERKVEACAAAGAFSLLTTTGPALRTFVDTNVQLGRTYCYRAFAVNATGLSLASNTAEKIIGMPVPPAPGNLVVTFIQALIDALESLKTGLLDLQ